MIILTDFDGTITRQDVLDEVLTRFADKKWLEIESEWLEGKIGSLECLRQQMALVSAGAGEIESLLDAVEIDPHFPEFLKYCFREEIPLKIVSDNFEWFIQHILKKNLPEFSLQLKNLPIYCNRIHITGNSLEFEFPYSSGSCTHGCATCKESVLEKVREAEKDEIIFIGDGFSDRYGAKVADLVFAKGKLLECSREDGIEAIPFDDFSKIHRWVESKRKARRLHV